MDALLSHIYCSVVCQIIAGHNGVKANIDILNWPYWKSIVQQKGSCFEFLFSNWLRDLLFLLDLLREIKLVANYLVVFLLDFYDFLIWLITYFIYSKNW